MNKKQLFPGKFKWEELFFCCKKNKLFPCSETSFIHYALNVVGRKQRKCFFIMLNMKQKIGGMKDVYVCEIN